MPVLLLAGSTTWQNYRAAVGRATSHLTVVRAAWAAREQAELDALRAQLAALAARPELEEAGPGCAELLRTALAIGVPGVSFLAVAGPSGEIGCAAPDADRAPAGAPALVGRARESGGLVLGTVQLREATHPAVRAAAQPLLRSGRFAGALLAGLPLDRPRSRPQMALDGQVWFVDADGTLTTAGDAPDGALPPPGVLRTLLASGSLALQATSRSGTPYAYGVTPLRDGLRLLVGHDARPERALAVRMLVGRVSELALLLLAGLAAVVVGADRALVRPIRRLGEAVARWRAGGLFDPAAVRGGPAELRGMAQSFADAAAALARREAELRAAVQQQELAMQEIHHRVKNNLQIVASLLNLQASRIRLPEAKAEFQSARDRVRALATLHRHLYTHGELHTINMREFLTELCGQLFSAMGEKENGRIQLDIQAPELQMSSDQAVPLALVVTEAVSNSVKYAFPGGRRGHVSVRLVADEASAELVIQDNGVGIPVGRSETETGTRDGIGLQLIRGFARQLGASLQVDEGGGTRYVLRMPLRRERASAPAA